jgi:hypothetical protein
MAELTGLAVTIGALALLLPPFGIMGAAMASVAGYGTVGVLLVAFSLRLTGVSPSALLCPNTADLQRILQRLQWYPASAVADSSNVPSRST